MMNSPRRRLATRPDPPAKPVGPLAETESADVRIVAAHALQIVWTNKPIASEFVLAIDDAGRHRLFQFSPLAGPYVVRG
jgi:hypothetical protein